MKSKKINAGIIGCGAISHAHISAYKYAGINPLALCDINTANAEELKKQYNLKDAEINKDYKKMLKLKELDIITIGTPPYLHTQQCLDSLRAGKHVVCEKPSAFEIKESKAIIRTAKKAKKKIVFTSARMRWGAAEIAKKYIRQGKLGKIYKVEVKYFRDRGRPGIDILPHARWFANKKLAGGGITPDMGHYFMDMVFNLTGWPGIKTVSAVTFQGFPFKLPKNIIYNVEEHCSIFLRTDKNINFSFEFANMAQHKMFRKITILGTKGGIIMDDEHFFQYITEKAPWKQVVKTIPEKRTRRSNDYFYRDFLREIKGEKTDIGTTPEQAYIITQVNLMAYLSAKKNREVTPVDIKNFNLKD